MDADPRDLLIQQLKAENARLREELMKTLERLEELERGVHRQAGPFRREEKKKVPPSERKKPGRKPGHEGFFRQAPEKIDQVIDVPLKRCPVCGGAVSGVVEIEQIIEEIPPVKPVAVKLTTHRGHCCKCGKDVRSTHPLQSSDASGCAKVQVGPRVLSLGMMLNKSFGLTMRKTVAVLEQLCGLRITPGKWKQARSDLEKTKDKLLDHPGQNIGDAKIRNRLIKHREHLLRCLEEPRAEPTNNRAERSLRPAVIARKVSCGNKTQSGKQTWQVLASIAATCQQRGEDLLEFIRPRLALNKIAG